MTDRRMGNQPQSLLYEAYMVRIWCDSPQASWRASAQPVAAGETINFGNLQALFEFLMLRAEKTSEQHPGIIDEPS